MQVFAHQPFESTIDARLQHNRLEVRLTMSLQSARQYAGGGAGSGEIEAPVEDLMVQLKQQAATLLQITAGGSVLRPRVVEAQFNKLGEWEVVLIFPEPPPGQVVMDAVFLLQMPLGYGGTLVVYDEDEKIIASASALSRGQSTLSWEWGMAKSSTGHIPDHLPLAVEAPSPVPAVLTVGESSSGWAWLAALAIGVALVVVLNHKRAIFHKRRNA
jgi:hypothetical protein